MYIIQSLYMFLTHNLVHKHTHMLSKKTHYREVGKALFPWHAQGMCQATANYICLGWLVASTFNCALFNLPASV